MHFQMCYAGGYSTSTSTVGAKEIFTLLKQQKIFLSK